MFVSIQAQGVVGCFRGEPHRVQCSTAVPRRLPSQRPPIGQGRAAAGVVEPSLVSSVAEVVWVPHRRSSWRTKVEGRARGPPTPSRSGRLFRPEFSILLAVERAPLGRSFGASSRVGSSFGSLL